MNGHFCLYRDTALFGQARWLIGVIENRLHLRGIEDRCKAAMIGRDRRLLVDNHHEGRSQMGVKAICQCPVTLYAKRRRRVRIGKKRLYLRAPQPELAH